MHMLWIIVCTGTLMVVIILYADPSHAKGFNMFLIIRLLETLSQLEELNNTIVVQAHTSNNNTVISRITRANIDNQPAHQEGTLIVA